MKCPDCSGMENKVIDSRLNKEGTVIRRRRECLSCSERFTTYEKLERSLPLVIKKDGRREEFDREKIIHGVQKACQKRPVSVKDIEDLVDRVEQYVQELGDKEVPALKVGEKVISEIYNLDKDLIVWEESPEKLQTIINGIITEDLMVEDRLNEEVKTLLDSKTEEYERSMMDYGRVFQMVKSKLVRERGLIL